MQVVNTYPLLPFQLNPNLWSGIETVLVRVLKKINSELERSAKMLRFLPKYRNFGFWFINSWLGSAMEVFYSKLNQLSKIILMFLIDIMIISQISSKNKIISYWQVINHCQISDGFRFFAAPSTGKRRSLKFSSYLPNFFLNSMSSSSSPPQFSKLQKVGNQSKESVKSWHFYQAPILLSRVSLLSSF